jgi:hypothetical protein
LAKWVRILSNTYKDKLLISLSRSREANFWFLGWPDLL